MALSRARYGPKAVSKTARCASKYPASAESTPLSSAVTQSPKFSRATVWRTLVGAASVVALGLGAVGVDGPLLEHPATSIPAHPTSATGPRRRRSRFGPERKLGTAAIINKNSSYYKTNQNEN